jgi:predicted DNA-binding transcriptional regulator AlpA
VIPTLIGEVAAQEAKLNTLKSILAARLAIGGNGATGTPQQGADLLDAGEAARRVGMSVGWLYKNAKRLPFTRRVGPRSIRFSAEGIRRYLAARA